MQMLRVFFMCAGAACTVLLICAGAACTVLLACADAVLAGVVYADAACVLDMYCNSKKFNAGKHNGNCISTVCGLPLSRYISGKCCRDEAHLENRGDEDFCQILVSAIASCRGCLEAAFPGCVVFNPTDSFADADGDMASLISLASMYIWQEDDPVQLTNAAYGDIAASLVKVVAAAATDPSADQLRRPRLESVNTRPREATVANTTPGWILGEAQKGGRGRGPRAGVLAVSAAPVAARHRTAAEPPAGCSTRKKA